MGRWRLNFPGRGNFLSRHDGLLCVVPGAPFWQIKAPRPPSNFVFALRVFLQPANDATCASVLRFRAGYTRIIILRERRPRKTATGFSVSQSAFPVRSPTSPLKETRNSRDRRFESSLRFCGSLLRFVIALYSRAMGELGFMLIEVARFFQKNCYAVNIIDT